MLRCVLVFLCLASFAFVPGAAIAKEGFRTHFDWGRLVATESSVELRIDTVPKDRVIRFPRFNNSYRRIYLKSDASIELKFKPEVREWLVTLPPATKPPAVVVLETVGKPQLLTEPFVITADDTGSYQLPANHAEVHGELLRFEPQPHKNTVGYWANADDWCQWKLEIAKPGVFAVYVLQGCGEGQGGSEVEIVVGESRLTFLVEDTGHFQNFKERMVGKLNLAKAGAAELTVKPVKKAKKAVMDVRLIRLVPLP